VKDYDGDVTIKNFNSRVYVDNVKVDSSGVAKILPKEFQETFDPKVAQKPLEDYKEGDYKEGLKTKLKKGLTMYGFGDAIQHIAFGRDCASEMALLTKLAALKQMHNDIVNKPADGSEQKAFCCFGTTAEAEAKKKEELKDKITAACGELAAELITPNYATGQAIITFKTEEKRDQFVSMMTHESGIFGASFSASVHPAPEPTDIVWENLELGLWWERLVVFMNFVLTVVLLLLSLGALTYIKDKQALISSDKNASEIAKYLAIGSSGAVSVITFGIKTIVKKSTEFEGLDTRTEIVSSLNGRLTMALVTNTVLVPFALAMYRSLRLSGYNRPLDQSWFESGSVIYAAVYLQVFNFAIYEGLKVFPIAPIINRYIMAKFAKTQFNLNRLWNPVPCDIATLYAVLLQAVSLCLLYAPMYPPLYLITAFVMLGTWMATKFACKWWYARPPAINEEMAESTRNALEWVLLLHIGVTTIADADENGINYDHTIIGVGMWLAFKLVLMPLLTDSLPLVKFGIPFFQNFDQISASKADDRILLTSIPAKEWMKGMHDNMITGYLTGSKYDDSLVSGGDEGPDEVTYDKASKKFMDVSNPAYISPSAKLTELMAELKDSDKSDKIPLAAKLTDLIMKISPTAPPSEVENKGKLAAELKLFEEAFWLANLYLVPRTYTVLDESFDKTDCISNGLKASGEAKPLCKLPTCKLPKFTPPKCPELCNDKKPMELV